MLNFICPFSISRKYLFLLCATLLVGFCLKLYRLEIPQQYYYDEVYYGFTAKAHLHGDREAYNPWSKSTVEKTSYAWDHPPLGKLIIAGTMAIVGDDWFGMRLSSVIFGTLAVYLCFLLAMNLFRSAEIATLAAFLMTIDGLAFTESRIAMVDSHLLCFILLALICWVKWANQRENWKFVLLTGIFVGAAVATKWTSLLLLLMFWTEVFIFWLIDTKPRPALHVTAWFIGAFLMPLVVYLSSYTQMFLQGWSFQDFWVLHQQMWGYHINLQATHDYQSKPWQWILDLRPVWFYINHTSDTDVANIYNLGNPFILYTGFISLLGLIWEFYRKHTINILGPVIIYAGLILPWFLCPRIMFFYHYLPVIPLLCTAMSYFVIKLSSSPILIETKLVKVPVILASVWFILFFPYLTGIPVAKSFADDVYFYVSSWK